MANRSLPALPRHFDGRSVVPFFSRTGYERLLRGEIVDAREADPEEDFAHELPDGPCLVTLWDAVHPASRDVGRDYVFELLQNLHLGSARNGLLKLLGDRSLFGILEDPRWKPTWAPREIPMTRAIEEICAPRGPRASVMPRMTAYAEILESGNFAGILNHARCHLACGRDIVRVKDYLCLFWLRIDEDISNSRWIEICPFRLTGPQRA